MGDGDKLIDDFSGIVSKTIRKYVKDKDALQEIANVLDDMSDDAYHDGYDEGYYAGIDVAHENAVDQYSEGVKDTQKQWIEALNDFTRRITDEYDAGNN